MLNNLVSNLNFNVKNKRTQSSFEVTKEQYVLNAAIGAGLALPHSCRVGNCGSCKALLLNGQVDHDELDEFALTSNQIQNGYILLCRCRARSNLEIDIEEFSELLSTSGHWPARISELKLLCHDVMLMRVELAPGKNFNYSAGQYMDFVLPDSKLRSYSIAGINGRVIDFHIRKVEGGLFSQRVFNRYKQGDIVRLFGPLGAFFIRKKNNQPIIMLAGGTGIAPIKSMLEKISKQNSALTSHLYWGVQTMEDIYLNYWLEEFSYNNNWFKYTIVLSNAHEFYTARKGFVHQAVLEDYKDLSQYQVYASGPPAMIKAAQSTFPDIGLSPQRLYFDSFDYSADTIANINANKTK